MASSTLTTSWYENCKAPDMCLLLTQVGQQDLHNVRSQINRSIVVNYGLVGFLRYWNNTVRIPHHWNLLLVQAKVEEELQNPTEFICRG